MFNPVASKPRFYAIEERILQFWKEHRAFERSVEQRHNGALFMLYEGPPTVNASPGIHHVLSRVFKDVFPRYKAMKGFYAPRFAGWDTHGLPVELGVEGELGLSSKAEIEKYGIGRFNQKCRENVTANIGEWNRLTERIGFWIDLDRPYITFDNNYIESCWWLIRQLWNNDLVYKGYRVTPHCPRCGTSLSSHEVALGYKENTPDPSIFIRFRIVSELPFDPGSDGPVYLLAWTTTPWTLTANVALAIDPEETYALVKSTTPEGDSERLILAKALLDQSIGYGNWEILEQLPGEKLKGIQYERLFEPKPDFLAGGGELHQYNPVVPAEFVSMEEGTGIVHIAPAYGQDDYELGKAEGLPVIHTVDMDGNMRPIDKPWSEKFIKEADPIILEDLKARGLLHHRDTIKHTYPFCWRCDTPLVYYAKPSWYIRTTARKEDLIKGNEQINWYPEHIKRGRFGDWLENNIDWAFSRERYWGTPLPIWQCDKCGNFDCIGSFDELKNKPGVAGIKGEPDFHRPYMDEITFTCDCGQTMRRVPEVIDCWFDSGAMPFAQMHYPFENETLLTDGRFPADYICEAVDQTRGWFYSLHALSMILFNRPAFRNVICLGHILDAEGDKMSKSKGNVVEPWQAINDYGADALRWYLITSTPAGNVRRFSTDAILEGLRRFLLTLWNTYSFFVTYANIDRFEPAECHSIDERPELDRWILSELNQLVQDVTRSYDNYDATGAGRKLEAFLDNLSNWYIRRSRRRFWKSESDSDKISAHSALYECLTTMSKLLAPILPFISEEIYHNLVRSAYPSAPESVHLADFPVANQNMIDERLSQDVSLVMKITSLGRSARSKAGLKVRQPLERAVIRVKANSECESLQRLQYQILDELNVKAATITTNHNELVEMEVKPNLSVLGPKYGKELNQIKEAISRLNPTEIADRIGTGSEIKADSYVILPNEVLVSRVHRRDYVIAEEGEYMVGIPSVVSEELLEEGLVREIVHRLQNMRRSAGFEITDYIETYYKGDERFNQVISKFKDYIKQETLTKQLSANDFPEGTYVEQHKLDGKELTLGVKR
ncbi:MAG: isoleucine--tRNA ligase [Dehalococcoidia bacterium]